MDQITRCPNCSTSFRVTDDQLAAHQGKVRCGRCSFIFNARDFLQRVETRQAEKTAVGIAQHTVSDLSYKPIPTEQQVAANDSHDAIEPDTSTSPAHSSPPAQAIEPQFPVVEANDSAAKSKDDKDLQRALARLNKKPQREKTRRARKPSRNTITEVEKEIPTNTDSQALSGAQLRQQNLENDAEYRPILDDTDTLFLPPKRSRWSWLWSLASLLLTLTLLAQLAYNFRLELSQEFPALRPKWQALCVHLKCDMPLPRQADLLRSEWSELTYIPDHPTLIQVKATLRNLAPYEQALPKLELTLTDENERVVAKKIFTPKEYLAQNDIAQNSLLSNDELHAFLQLDLGNLNSTGYSLFWFYD